MNSLIAFKNRFFTGMVGFLLAATVAAAQVPQIDTLSASTLARSGRLRISGSGFGSANSKSLVTIGNHAAIVTRWSNTSITAYVPELAGPGTALVQVLTPAGASNTEELNVTTRQAQGRVRWAFEADVNDLWWRPALAPDGTIYVHGSEGFVFALAPDGGLKWVHKVNGYAYVPPAAGPDGAVYVGCVTRLTAINPDGTERWRFTDPTAQGIELGVAFGPDANLYLANDLGLGAYSLMQDGQLRWSNLGNPTIYWYGGIGGEMVLGPRTPGGPIEQMYVVTKPLAAQATLQAFRMSDGSQRFSVPAGGTDPTTQQQIQPATGPDGTIYLTHNRGGGIGWTLEALSPLNGQSLWYYNSFGASTAPDVSPDGTVYYVGGLANLVAFNPATLSPRWVYNDGTILNYPTVSPDNDMVVCGGVITYGDLGFVKAISSSGQLLWTVNIPGSVYPGPRPVPVHHPRFTPDGETVYVSTVMLAGSSDNPHSYLYAIRTHDLVPGDITGDGLVNVSDLLAVINSWGPCPAPPASCPADVTGDGTVNVSDLLMIIGNWS